jgi:hypothetical protein
VRLLNAVLVGVTLLAVAGGYVQERARLAKIRRLPVEEARALYERAAARRERGMVAVAAALVVSAVIAIAVRLAS